MARVRADDHDEKKAHITNHASLLFVAEGFSRVSMAHLAEACDISKSNLYHYYKDKDEILFSILDEHMDDILLSLQKCTGASRVSHLEGLIEQMLSLYQNADNKHRILLNDLKVLPEEKQQVIRAKERLIVQYFKHAILHDYPSYATQPQLLSAAAMSLLGSINWSFTWFKGNKGLTIEEYAQFLGKIYREGLHNDST